jgi:hypothetical protein
MKREKMIKTKINWQVILEKYEIVRDITAREYQKLENDKRFKVKKIKRGK